MSRNKYPEQTVEKILDAAACLFAQKGYAHTTLQDVIDETGLSKGAVYHHFKSKEEIAAKVGERMGAEFTATLAHIRDDDAMTGLQNCRPSLPRRYCRSASKRWAAHCRAFGMTLSFFPLSCTICWKRLSPFT